MNMEEFDQNAIRDRLEGWELVEFLQIPIDEVLRIALENDWINEENILDVQELVGLKQ